MDLGNSLPPVQASRGLFVRDAYRAQQLQQQMGSLQQSSQIRPAMNSAADDDTRLKEVARKFEAMLVHQMLKAMRQTVPKSGLFDSFALGQYESMLDEEIANEVTTQKGIGLADTFYRQLNRMVYHQSRDQ